MEFGTELKILREKEKKRKSRLHQTIVTVRMASSTVCMHRVSFCCDGVHVAESVKLVLARNKLLGLLIRESPLGFGGGGGGGAANKNYNTVMMRIDTKKKKKIK